MTKSNIFKRIAAGLLSLTMLIGVVPAMAEESVDTEATTEVSLLKDHELELLMKLNIVTEAMSKLKTEEMSRGVFSEMLTAMLGVGGGDNAIEELYNLGIVNGYGNGKLKENQTITYYEAIKMVVCALGYATVAETNGGYPLGYVKVAYDIDLISGSVENGNMTYDQGMKLMLDAGNANTATVSNDYYLSGIELGGDTLFYTYFDVMRVEGLMSANGYTSLDGKDCLIGEVIIGGNTMETGETAASDLIGYTVEAYCYDYDVIDEVIVAAPLEKYNKELTILAGSYINATGNLQQFTVDYEKEGGKIDDIKVADYYVIYNGKLYGGLTLDQLNASLADVTFIDNDRDNYYEIVKIDEYETYIVESINADKYELYAKYDKALTIDPDNQDVFIYKSSGKPGEFKDIASGAALSVLKSQDGELVKVYILGETASGAIEGVATVDGHRVITIGGKQYVVTYEYENLVHEDKVEPVMNAAVKAVLDLRGNIVEIELTSGVWLYGYVMKLGYDVDNEEYKTLSIFSQTNKRLDLTLGERVTVDGVSRKVKELGNDGVGVLDTSGAVPKAIRQLVRYREEGGRLIQLDTWNTFNPETEDEDSLGATKAEDMCFANGTDFSGKFSRTSGYFTSATAATIDQKVSSEVVVGGDDNTICFTIPIDDSNANDEFYYTAGKMKSMFADQNTYNKGSSQWFEAYNLNEAKVAKVVIRNLNDTKNPDQNTTNYVFIKELSTVINKNGEATTHVVGMNLNTGAEYSRDATLSNTMADTNANDFLATKQFGDVFRYRDVNVPDEGNVMFSGQTFTDLNKDYGYMNGASYVSIRAATKGSDANTYFADTNEYVGNIGWANNTHMRLEADEPYTVTIDGVEHTGFETFSCGITGTKIYLADCAEETIETIDATRVAAYTRDKIGEDCKTYVVQKDGTVLFMIIYTNFSARD
ncbi:MAG: S-layer homology domain-containing protein [Clostridia bacterium]|nr:S-layer homology domain-containing protein [Clostridia bacterium]